MGEGMGGRLGEVWKGRFKERVKAPQHEDPVAWREAYLTRMRSMYGTSVGGGGEDGEGEDGEGEEFGLTREEMMAAMLYDYDDDDQDDDDDDNNDDVSSNNCTLSSISSIPTPRPRPFITELIRERGPNDDDGLSHPTTSSLQALQISPPSSPPGHEVSHGQQERWRRQYELRQNQYSPASSAASGMSMATEDMDAMADDLIQWANEFPPPQ